MPATPPPGAHLTTREKQLQYYGQLIARLVPGTYQGNDPRYKGETWEQVFFSVAEQAPNTPVQVIASKIAGLAAVQNVALGIGAGTNQFGNFANDVTKLRPPNLGGFTSVLDFLNKLGDPHLWLRIAEGILGVILIATAVSKMTGAGSAIGKAARKVPLVV